MTVTAEQAKMLTELALAVRPHGAPRWDRQGIYAAIGRVKGRSLASVTIAVVQAAEDRAAVSPGVIPGPGPHWREPTPGDRPAHFPPKLEEVCAAHGGHRDHCPGCAADRLAEADDPTPPAPPRTDDNPIDHLRSLVRTATHPTEEPADA